MENPINIYAGSDASIEITEQIKQIIPKRMKELMRAETEKMETLLNFENMTQKQRDDSGLKSSEIRAELHIIRSTMSLYSLVKQGFLIGFVHTTTSKLTQTEYDLFLKERKIFGLPQ